MKYLQETVITNNSQCTCQKHLGPFGVGIYGYQLMTLVQGCFPEIDVDTKYRSPLWIPAFPISELGVAGGSHGTVIHPAECLILYMQRAESISAQLQSLYLQMIRNSASCNKARTTSAYWFDLDPNRATTRRPLQLHDTLDQMYLQFICLCTKC